MFVSARLVKEFWAWSRAAIALTICLICLLSPHLGSAQAVSDPSIQDNQSSNSNDVVPPKPEKFDRVYDVASVLDKSEYDRFHYDIGRLWYHDLPSVIYIRMAESDGAQSQLFADTLRDTWDIESAPGADDGLVLLVTIRTSFPYSAILSLSYGENTFPTGQMTVELLDLVVETEANPRLEAGNVNGGLTYALRRVIYYTEYTAPFPPERTSAQNFAHNIALPFNAFLAVVFVAVMALPDKRLPISFVKNRKRNSIVAGTVIVVISILLGVYGRATLGTAYALINVILLGALLMQPDLANQRRRILRASIRSGRMSNHLSRRRTHQRV